MYTLFAVNVSNVIGVINFVAFSVIITFTFAFCFFNILARVAILYAAIPPVTPSNIFLFSSIKPPKSLLNIILIDYTLFYYCKQEERLVYFSIQLLF